MTVDEAEEADAEDNDGDGDGHVEGKCHDRGENEDIDDEADGDDDDDDDGNVDNTCSIIKHKPQFFTLFYLQKKKKFFLITFEKIPNFVVVVKNAHILSLCIHISYCETFFYSIFFMGEKNMVLNCAETSI